MTADEAQRLVPAGIARAEAAWLAGDPAEARRFADEALATTAATADALFTGEAAFWRWRAGGPEEVPDGATGRGGGRSRATRGARRTSGGPWAPPTWRPTRSPSRTTRMTAAEALAVFDRLGAARSAAVLRARMRERGAAVPRAPGRAPPRAPTG